jgi:hypothetical protein
MSIENSLWGAPLIHGELLKLEQIIRTISGVAEEVCAFVRFELLQGIGCGSLESVEGSRSGLAHMRLELGKGIFDRIEIWTVGRPIVEFGAAAGRDRGPPCRCWKPSNNFCRRSIPAKQEQGWQ